MTLLDSKGSPVSSAHFKRAPGPKTGEAFAVWGENGYVLGQLPLGGIVQFNLENLSVHDFRAMRTHYQVNASLAVLSFMQHQSDWHIQCEDQKIADEAESQLRKIWTPLNRAMSHANWAGYSPNIMEWENDPVGGRVEVNKIKDLVPESAEINWKEVDAWRPAGEKNFASAKVKIYDGIKQVGAPWATPVENTYWYPLLMEHGNYKGVKLLKAAFTSWYFSILIHLFANRYYERFGEPIVVGRAPFDEELMPPGGTKRVSGVEYLLSVIKDLRSRSVVTLPNDTTIVGDSNKTEYDYGIQYLESQMRGADWERYLTRLDEEISIGLFTPILLLRTADVGSYNLGVGHMQMYLWMLNAMNSDRALYIDKYILSRITDFNFSPRAPRPHIKFRKLGNQNAEIIRTIIEARASQGTLGVDIKELGEIAGLTLKEIKSTLQEPEGPEEEDDDDEPDTGSGVDAPRKTSEKITARIRNQVDKMFKTGGPKSDSKLDPGFRMKLQRDLYHSRVADPVSAADQILGNTMAWAHDFKTAATSADQFVHYFKKVLDSEIAEYVK